MKQAQYLNGKNVLILGGLGFMGSNLAHELVRNGAKVSLYDSLLPGYGGNLFNIEDIKKDVCVIKKDIRDPESLIKAVKNKDLIFNFAAQVSYIDSLKNPLLDLDINVKGQMLLLEAARKVNRDAVLFFSSSRMVYGKNTRPLVTENNPTNPLNLYGIHKLACEQYLNLYYREFGIHSVVFRITNPYGPRQQMVHSKYSLVGWFIRQAMENKVIRIFGDGKQSRDYIYIDDLISSFILVANKNLRGYHCFNIGTGQGTTFGDMVASVIKGVKQGKVEHVEWPKNYKTIETGSFIADISKLRKITGWKPKISMDEGILKTYDYYKKFKKYYWP